MTDHGEVSAFVDYEQHQFVTRDGTRLTLQPIPKMILERLYSDQNGKPKPPVVEVVIGGQFARKETNPDDPAYKQALEEWRAQKSMRILKYGLVHGVVENPPTTFIQEYIEYFPDESEAGMKYLWILSLLGSEGEDIRLISEAVVGQTAPTDKGIEIATDSFPRDGAEHPGDGLPAVETAN